MTQWVFVVRQTNCSTTPVNDLVEALREDKMRNRQNTGDLVKLLAAIAIIAVTSVPMAASLVKHGGAAAGFPEWTNHR